VTHKSPSSTDFAAIWQKAIATVDDALESSKGQTHAPASTLIDRWIAKYSNPAFPLRPVRRSPASAVEIQAAESRLGHPLPEQVRELYLATDGLDWVRSTGRDMSFGGHFPPLRLLGLARDLEVPFSTQLLRHCETYDEPDETRHVELFGPAVLAHVVEEPELIFEFEELDAFLALQVASDATCILIAHREGLRVPVGTVLHIENVLATRYSSVSHWLAADVGMSLAALGY
jgi:hypothetical protein